MKPFRSAAKGDAGPAGPGRPRGARKRSPTRVTQPNSPALIRAPSTSCSRATRAARPSTSARRQRDGRPPHDRRGSGSGTTAGPAPGFSPRSLRERRMLAFRVGRIEVVCAVEGPRAWGDLVLALRPGRTHSASPAAGARRRCLLGVMREPRREIACLRARATLAFRGPVRSAIVRVQARSAELARHDALAASWRWVRVILSPCREMQPSRLISPDS